ncbi:MAG: 16S rRNA (guanine(966)-N(2))-methyltransferase RsmD [Eubacterium sp.]|nr:16S rRNA (guanine(966)-N(2))-methyltransferase RsmD [Eubacterium sp.]
MRVITGSARGRRLETLRGDDVTRPTAENVKEALFSMIQFEIEGKRALDLFAGSGQLGIEALSRGAEFCAFIENNKNAAAVVKSNVERCGFSSSSQLVNGDAISYLTRAGGFDIVFLDPPYGKGFIQKCMPYMAGATNDNAIIICETSKDEVLPEKFSGFSVDRERNHGKTKITLYRKD